MALEFHLRWNRLNSGETYPYYANLCFQSKHEAAYAYAQRVRAHPPLPWVLHDHLGLVGTK